MQPFVKILVTTYYYYYYNKNTLVRMRKMWTTEYTAYGPIKTYIMHINHK